MFYFLVGGGSERGGERGDEPAGVRRDGGADGRVARRELDEARGVGSRRGVGRDARRVEVTERSLRQRRGLGGDGGHRRGEESSLR